MKRDVDDQGTDHDLEREQQRFLDQVSARKRRMLSYRLIGDKGPWFGLGMFGLVGWSVAVPFVGGALIGVWLDKRFGTGIRWTLGLMFLGLVVGGSNVWTWLIRESEEASAGTKVHDTGDQSDGTMADDTAKDDDATDDDH